MTKSTRLSGTSLLATISASALITTTPALADEAPDGANSSPEIIVTAQKRAQRTIDVPISITALSGDALNDKKITQSEQLADITPSLSWTSTSGETKPAIFLRGVGNSDYRGGTNSPVGTYIDGVYQGNAFAYGQLLLDLDRVEVLRGPQGTLWGKNTTGGLINYIPKLASSSASPNMRFDLSYGNYNAIKASGAFGVPLADNLAVRVAAGVDRDDGYFRSVNPATSGRYGGSSWTGVRGSIAYDPTPDLVIVGQLNYSVSDSNGAVSKAFGVFDPAAAAFSFEPCASPASGRLGSPCADVLGYVGSPDPYVIAPNADGYQRISTISPMLKADLSLGDYTVTSLTGYVHGRHSEYYDADDTPSPLFEYTAVDSFHSFSQELRLTSPDNQLFTWIAGLYFYSDSLDYFNSGPVPVYGTSATATMFKTKSQNYAAFADATYHLTPTLNVSAGLRYTLDRRSLTGQVVEYDALVDQPATTEYVRLNQTGVILDHSSKRRRSDNNLSGRISIDYHPTPLTMIYASVSRGFKGGDVNGGLQIGNSPAITGPEHLTAYEAGFKGSIIPRVLTLEVSGFYYNYDDAQVFQQVGPNDLLSNAGKIRIYGTDGNVTLTPSDRLEFNLGFSFLDATYVSYANGGLNTDYSGNRIPYTSKVQLSGGVSYKLPVGETSSLRMALDGTYRSKYFFDPSNDGAGAQPGYFVANGNINFEFGNGLDLGVWVRNLTDKIYLPAGYNFSFAGANFAFPAAPRTYGVTLGYQF